MTDVSRLIQYRKRQDYYFQIVGAACTAIGVLTLAALLIKLSWDGLSQVVRFEFFTDWPSLVRIGITILFALGIALPLGVFAGVRLIGYAKRNWLMNLVCILALRRSIACGLISLILLAYMLGLSGNIIVGSISLGLLVLPSVVVSTLDTLRWSYNSVRESAAGSRLTHSQWKWSQQFRESSKPVVQIALSACKVAVVVMLGAIAWNGLSHFFRVDFFLTNASYNPEKAGILTAWVGTLGVMVVTFATAVPLGVGAAVYLEEYAHKNVFTNLIEINISNLAGVPSISYGLMAMWLFSHILEWKSSVFVGGLTLALLILPIVIVSTREALRSIPNSIREAAYAAGATRWQTIRFHLLPYSLGGIATGTIIAMSRAMGETAPLIVIGASGFLTNLPPSPIQPRFPFLSFDWLNSSFTVLPMQMFYWTSEPGFEANAAAAGLVLIAFTLSVNAIAIVLRYRVRQKIKW